MTLPFHNQCYHLTETSELHCRANQLVGFYMMVTWVSEGLSRVLTVVSVTSLKQFFAQLTFTCSKSTIETLQKGMKCVQSSQ